MLSRKNALTFSGRERAVMGVKEAGKEGDSGGRGKRFFHSAEANELSTIQSIRTSFHLS